MSEKSRIEFCLGDEQFCFVTDEATAGRFIKSIRAQCKQAADLKWARDCLKMHGIQTGTADPIATRLREFKITNISVAAPSDFVMAMSSAY